MMNLSNDLKRYDELLGFAYSGIHEPQLWNSFVNCFQEVIGARDVSIVIESKPLEDKQVKSRYMLISTDKAPHLTAEYLDSVMDVNMLMDIPQPRAAAISDVMPTGTFFNSQLYQQFLKPIDVRHLMSVDICRTETLMMKLSVERTEQQGMFTERERQLFEMIIPHLRRAIEFKANISQGGQFQSFYERLMDKMDIGCIVLDERGKLLSNNTFAQNILSDERGLAIRSGKLVALESSVGSELKQAIKTAVIAKLNACKAQNGMGLRVGDSSNTQLDLVVKPLFSKEMSLVDGSPTVAVFVSECVQSVSSMDVQALAKIYGFTKCEARIGSLLCAGMTIAEASDEVGVSINTAKTHLRGIYEKTGFNRQSQVVALLNKSSARLL